MCRILRKKVLVILCALFIGCLSAALFAAFPFTKAQADTEETAAEYKVFGASVRVADETYSAGLRLHVVMPKADYESLPADATTGVLIVPKAVYSGDLNVGVEEAIDQDTTRLWYAGAHDGNDYYESVVCLTKIPRVSYGARVAVRGYTLSGGQYTYTAQKEVTFGKTAQWAYENDDSLSETQKENIKSEYLKTVSFYNGTEKNEKAVGYGEKLSETAAPSVTASNFLGWYGENGEKFAFDAKIKSDTKLFAVYSSVIDCSSATNALDLSSFTSNGISITGISCEGVDLGTDASAINGAALVDKTGENKAVAVTLSNGGALNMTATVITKYIFTLADLESIRPTAGNIGGYYVLKNDIDAGTSLALNWTWNRFNGTFDGNGYKIRSAHVTGGVFVALDGATIKNLTLDALWYKEEGNTAILAKRIERSSLINVTVNVVAAADSITEATEPANTSGLVSGWGASDSIFRNLTINASDKYIVSVFGGNNYNDKNQFVDCSIVCAGIKEIGHSASESFTTEIGLTINGGGETHTHTYVNVAGETEDVIKCSVCGETVKTFHKTLTDSAPQYVNAESMSLNLSGVSEYESVKSATIAGYDVGKNLSALSNSELTAAKAKHGSQTAAVVVTDSYGLDHTISVPVIVVTQEFTDIATLTSVLRRTNDNKNIYGYYTIGQNIDAGTYNPGPPTISYGRDGFKGTLDGKGHYIKMNFSTFNRGLIGELDDALIKNLTFETTGNSPYEITFVGWTVYNTTFENCTFKVSGGNDYSTSIGLVYGHAASVGNAFKNCKFEASVAVGYWVTKKADGSLSATFENCTVDCPKGYLGIAEGFKTPEGVTDVNPPEYTATEPTEAEIVNLAITDGTLNMQQVYTFSSYGIKTEDVTKITFAGKTLNHEGFSISVSEFGKVYGENSITVHYTCGGKNKTLDVPVLLVTNILTTKADIDNFLSMADAYNGVTGDNIYDGYFMLGNDIAYNDTYIPPMVIECTAGNEDENLGFRGVFDGAGHSISGLSVVHGVYDAKGDCNRWTGFISVLHKNGVIKNTAFPNASVQYCSFLASYGGGTVENVYIEYKNVSGNPWNSTVNTSRKQGLSITMKDCVVSYDSSWTTGDLLGKANATDNAYRNVYVVGNGYESVVGYYNNDTLSEVKTDYPLGSDNLASYSDVKEFFAERDGEIRTWEYFDVIEAGMTVGGRLCLEGKASEKTFEGNVLVSADKTYSDYVIIYENDNDYALNAAAFIAESLRRATGTITYTTQSGGQVLQTLNGGINVPMMTSAPKARTENSAYIVIGTTGSDSQPTAAEGRYIVQTVGNTVFIHADKDEEYITAALLFLQTAIGYKALSDDTVYYEMVNGSAINMPFMEFDCDSAYNLRGVTNAHRVWKNNQLALNGRDRFAIGPKNPVTGKTETFHNSIYWLNYQTNQSAHPAWFRTFNGGIDVCYSAGGNTTEFNAMVAEAAVNIRNVFISNPGVTELTFTLQDNDLNGCSCSACGNSGQTNAAVKFLNAVVQKIVALDSAEGIVNRDFTVYLCAYYYLLDAPTIDMNEHLGVIYAPVRHSSEGKSVYDSANDSVRAQIQAWTAKTDNIGFWFYSTLFHNYMIPTDTFRSMLTWLEFAARTVKSAGKDIAWIYINGQSSQYLPSCFEAFKKYVYARAEVEILDKVTVDGTNSGYMTQISAYLTELENDFFARNANGTFIEGGYYGAAEANEAMYNLYKQMCTDYASIAKDYTTYEYIGKIKRAGGLFSTTYNMLDEYLASSYTDGYFINFTKSMIETYMGYVAAAQTALTNYEGAMKSVYELHVLAESMAPRFMICVAGGTNDSNYGFSGGYGGTSISAFRTAFKNDCIKLGLVYYGESRSMQNAFTKWGV